MALTKEELGRLCTLFDIPQQFLPEALKMLSEQEQRLILLMEKRAIEAGELAELIRDAGIARSPQALIDAAYRRVVLKKLRSDKRELQYQTTDFYSRYPYYAQYEYEEYKRFPRARKDKLNEWDYGIYFDAFKDIVKAKMDGDNQHLHDGDFMTLDEACAAVMQQDFIYRVPCNCKCMMDLTDKPRNVCIRFEGGDNSDWDRGYGQQVTAEQAVELLKEWNRRGLMPNGVPELEGGFCNCDCPSCYPIQMAKELGSRGVYPRAYYTIAWDAESCINCGRCVNVCNFGAFTKDEAGKVSFDPENCWGCTVCTDNCPKHAISRTKKEGIPAYTTGPNNPSHAG